MLNPCALTHDDIKSNIVQKRFESFFLILILIVKILKI